MHTFDPRMIVMRTRTSNRRVSENGANGGNDNHCSIFLQSSASSSLRDFSGKQITGSKLPDEQQTNSRSNSRFPTIRRQQVVDPRCDLTYVSRVSRFQIQVSDSMPWLPGSGDPWRDPDQNCGSRRREECHEPGHQLRNPSWRHP